MPRFIPIRILTAILSITATLASVSSRAAGAVGPTVIGSEANVTLPPSSAWNYLVPVRPGNNETVTVNPPLFSWLYAPGSPLNSSVDQNVYFFQFQADYDGSFTHPVVDVRTPSCCYNFLAPFSQSTVHWRVGYVTSAGVTNAWITNSFTIAPNATNWDRSMLANPSYLAGKAAHPHLMFNSAILPSVKALIPDGSRRSHGNEAVPERTVARMIRRIKAVGQYATAITTEGASQGLHSPC